MAQERKTFFSRSRLVVVAPLLVIASYASTHAKRPATSAASVVVVAVTFTGSAGKYNVSPPQPTLYKNNGDTVSWVNHTTDTDILVCMRDRGPHAAFGTPSFHILNGNSTPSGPLQVNAYGGGHSYYYDYYFGGQAANPCPVPPHGDGKLGITAGPKAIVVQ